MCSKLPATFALFPVLSRGYAHAQLSPLYLLSTFGAFHVTKNTRLSTPAQLQCSCSRAWEPGNEAMSGWPEMKTSKVLAACLSTEQKFVRGIVPEIHS